MLGPLALVAMRQEQGEPGQTGPHLASPELMN